MTVFFVILGAILVIVLMFFIFKWINSGKIKRLEHKNSELFDQNIALENRNKGLNDKMDQMNRERSAAGNHMHRLVRTQEETGVLYRKIDKAHTDKEIMELMKYIDSDNNSVVRG